MNGLGIEFMLGGVTLLGIKLFFLAIILYLGYKIITKLIKNVDGGEENLKVEAILLILVTGFLFLFSGATSPKIAIKTTTPMELKNYQQNTEQVEIITPSPRTETLKGFKAME